MPATFQLPPYVPPPPRVAAPAGSSPPPAGPPPPPAGPLPAPTAPSSDLPGPSQAPHLLADDDAVRQLYAGPPAAGESRLGD